MIKKRKYPIEAFALAAVIFSGTMQEAMIVGIGIIFGHVLQCVIRDNYTKMYSQTMSALGAAITCGAICLMYFLTGMEPEARQIIGFAAVGLLLVKHEEAARQEKSTETDYSQMLTVDSCVYGLYVLLAIVREYLTKAEIFTYALREAPIVSSAYGKPMSALICAGLFIAIANRIFKCESNKNSGLWVCIPVILLEVPFTWNHVPLIAGMAVGVLTAGVVYITLRTKLVYSNTENSISGLPVELIMLGAVYMIFGFL